MSGSDVDNRIDKKKIEVILFDLKSNKNMLKMLKTGVWKELFM